MGFRCELCDRFLNILQFSHLCAECYKIRTIIKCYNTESILNNLQNHFLICEEKEKEIVDNDSEFQVGEQERLEEELKEKIEEQKPQSVEDFNKLIAELKVERNEFSKKLKEEQEKGKK